MLCQRGYLDQYARENTYGWAGLADFYRHIRDANSGASSSRGPSSRQVRDTPDEVHALRLHIKELEQRHKEDTKQIANLEERIAELENPPQPEDPARNNEVEVARLFEEASIPWATGGETSHAFQSQEHSLNEALQRQENYTRQRGRTAQQRTGGRPSSRVRRTRRGTI